MVCFVFVAKEKTKSFTINLFNWLGLLIDLMLSCGDSVCLPYCIFLFFVYTSFCTRALYVILVLDKCH